MSHFTVLVAVRAASSAQDAEHQLDEILEPYNEQLDVPTYLQWESPEGVEQDVDFYREHPEYCDGEGGPAKPFDEFVTEGNIEAWHEWTRQAVGAMSTGDPDQGVFDPDNDRYGYRSTLNPDGHWDWWVLGGRWHGFWLLKPQVSIGSKTHPFPAIGDSVKGELQITPYAGQDAILGPGGVGGDDPTANYSGRADLARKGDIDLDGMRTLAGIDAERTFDQMEAATQGVALPETFAEVRRHVFVDNNVDPDLNWGDWMPEEDNVEVRKNAWQALLNQARSAYHEQPFIQALQKAQLLGWFGDPVEDYCLLAENPRETFIEQARARAVSTFAMVIDGQWVAQGDMGWFGMSSNEKDEGLWLRQVNHYVDTLPEDTWLAIVDCHV